MRGAFLVIGCLLLLTLASCTTPPGTIPTVVVYDREVPQYYEHLWTLVDQQGQILLFEPNEKFYSTTNKDDDKFAVVSKAKFHDKRFPGPVILFTGGEQKLFESPSGWTMAYASSPTEKSGLSNSTIILKPVSDGK